MVDERKEEKNGRVYDADRVKHVLLKKYWGHDSFREGQKEVIDAILEGRDVLCIMPTGGGKSVCYQIPAMMEKGVTLVVSPLISLMKDQVGALVRMGVPAAFLNSSLTQKQYYTALERAALGWYKIIYVAPERLATEEFAAVCSSLRISLIAVDEAHCVSQWGQDFRPGYLKIADFVDSLSTRPIVAAFTATATEEVKEDISELLRLESPHCITTGFDRENLFFSVLRTKNKFDELLSFILQRKDKSGIVYCATRKNVEEVCIKLNNCKINAIKYHAGLSDEERRKNQDDFLYDRKTVMVATNAFGMGIDKSNVSYVVHYNMPKSMEAYYQEAGRAGRDGNTAECLLLFSAQDVIINRFLIEHSDPNPLLEPEMQESLREKDFERLNRMEAYCFTDGCLRANLLSYFGESAKEHCGFCSNCRAENELADVTALSRHVLSCIAETGETFGKRQIASILYGSRDERSKRYEDCQSYGSMSSLSQKRILELIDRLIGGGYISVSSGEYPILTLSAASGDILFDGKRVLMRFSASEKAQSKEKKEKGRQEADIQENPELFAALKELRRRLGDVEGVPAYIIFTDATLKDMVKKQPENEKELLSVVGVGEVKLKKYGKAFLSEIKKFLDREMPE